MTAFIAVLIDYLTVRRKNFLRFASGLSAWRAASEGYYGKKPGLKATVSCSFSATYPRKDSGIVVEGISTVSHKVKC